MTYSYQIIAGEFLGQIIQVCIKRSDNASIPYDTNNTDYKNFKIDLANGVQLMDADGNPMTADQIQTFLQGLA